MIKQTTLHKDSYSEFPVTPFLRMIGNRNIDNGGDTSTVRVRGWVKSRAGSPGQVQRPALFCLKWIGYRVSNPRFWINVQVQVPVLSQFHPDTCSRDSQARKRARIMSAFH